MREKLNLHPKIEGHLTTLTQKFEGVAYNPLITDTIEKSLSGKLT